MSRFEKTELFIILVFSISSWFFASFLPNQMTVGNLVLTVSALLLLQSLIRDLFLIKQLKRKASQSKEMRCMCLESIVGMTGVILGASVVGVGISQLVTINKMTWALLITLTMVISFLIKDLVVHSKPWRITRDKDHLNILVTWR